MISAFAQAVHDECWWLHCRLQGAPVAATLAADEGTTLRLCGLHAQLVGRILEERPDVSIELWHTPQGLPVLLAEFGRVA